MYRKQKYSSITTRTLKEKNIHQTRDGEFRFVNHEDKVATLGFPNSDELKGYTYIRFDEITVPLMQKRYKQFFEK